MKSYLRILLCLGVLSVSATLLTACQTGANTVGAGEEVVQPEVNNPPPPSHHKRAHKKMRQNTSHQHRQHQQSHDHDMDEQDTDTSY